MTALVDDVTGMVERCPDDDARWDQLLTGLRRLTRTLERQRKRPVGSYWRFGLWVVNDWRTTWKVVYRWDRPDAVLAGFLYFRLSVIIRTREGWA